MFLKIVFCAVLSAGLILVSLDIFKIPYLKTSRAVKSLLKKRSKKESAAELWLSGLSVRLAKVIHINEYKRISLANDLASADIPLTPEQFRANAIVKAGVTAVFAVPFAFIFPLLCPVFLIAAVVTYTGENRKLTKKLKKRREKIEYALPPFAVPVLLRAIRLRE